MTKECWDSQTLAFHALQAPPGRGHVPEVIIYWEE